MNARFITPRLTVRTLHPADARALAAFLHRNRAFHEPWDALRDESYFTPRAQRSLLRRASRDASVHLFGIIRRDVDGTPARLSGTITISNIVAGAFCSGFLGYRIDVADERHGYMREALIPVLDWAFDEARLHRVEANIMPENSRSIRLVERLGFWNEGCARAYLRIGGVWRDHLHYAMTAEEWNRRRRSG